METLADSCQCMVKTTTIKKKSYMFVLWGGGESDYLQPLLQIPAEKCLPPLGRAGML